MSLGEKLVHDLSKRFPQLKPLVVNHLYENFGEWLPSRFLGEVLFYALATYDTAEPAEAQPLVQPILDFIERRFREGDDDLRKLIRESFVEPLATQGDAGLRLRLRLGPALQAAAEQGGTGGGRRDVGG